MEATRKTLKLSGTFVTIDIDRESGDCISPDTERRCSAYERSGVDGDRFVWLPDDACRFYDAGHAARSLSIAGCVPQPPAPYVTDPIWSVVNADGETTGEAVLVNTLPCLWEGDEGFIVLCKSPEGWYWCAAERV